MLFNKVLVFADKVLEYVFVTHVD